MKSNILYTILYVFISLIVISCQEDDNYSRIDYNPKGGFTQEDFTIESVQYLKSSTEDVKVVLEFNRLEGKTATFNIEINNIEPAHNANAFTLTTTSESISANIDTITVGQIDWSQLDCDSSLYVTLNLVSENTEFGTNTESITLTIYKDAAPSLDLGNDIIDATFPFGVTTGTLNKTFTFAVFDKPLEEDIILPLAYSSSGYTRGVHFDIDTAIIVSAGNTSAEVNLTAYADQFSLGEQVTIYLEGDEDYIPAGKKINIGSNWWKGFTIGLGADFIYLDKDATYDALMDASFEGEMQKITLKIPVLDEPANQNIIMPIHLNEIYLQEGTHFELADHNAYIPIGETEFEFVIYIYNDVFSSGESNNLWLEFWHSDIDPEKPLLLDPDYWWTTINVGKN